MAAQVTIMNIGWRATIPLRNQILRPGKPPEDCQFPFDDHPLTLHVGALEDGITFGVGSLLPENETGDLDPAARRIRGMAVLSDFRGRGIGSIILKALLKRAQDEPDVTRVWCQARTPAQSLYQANGFEPRGEPFDLPDIGPHVLMEMSASVLKELVL